jgi:hypothetical protein
MAEKEQETSSKINYNIIHKDEQPINLENEEENRLEVERMESDHNKNLDPSKIEVEEIKVTKIQIKGRKKAIKNSTPNELISDSILISDEQVEQNEKKELNKNHSGLNQEEPPAHNTNKNDSPLTKTKNTRKKTKKQIAEENIKLTEVFKSEKEELNQEENKMSNEVIEPIKTLDVVILDSENEIKTQKRSKSKSKETIPLPLHEDLPCFINLNYLNNQNLIPNSQMIKAIMEICYHSQNYGISIPNNTREFWKNVYEKVEWENILKKFQSETLRKYWRTLRDINQPMKIIELIETYYQNFDANNVK